MTRILGVDPGSLKTGWAVIDAGTSRNAITHVDNGVIVTNPDAPLAERLVRIARGLADVIAAHRPGMASVETAYSSKNARSALVLGQARGAVILTCAQHALHVFEYGPMQVKLAVTGSGRSGKESVQAMVAVLAHLPEVAQEDASDALAIALTHAFHAGRPAAVLQALPKGPSRRARKGSRAQWEVVLKARGAL